MEQVKAALTRKVGPFPGWAWAAIAAAGIWLVLPHLKGPANSATSTTPVQGDPGAPGVAGAPGAAGTPGAPGASAGPPASPPPAPAPSPPPTAQHKTHIVVSGDTLWGIAQTYLGNGSRYPEIFALSHFRSGNPNLIYPGEVAVLPLDATGGGIGGPSPSIGNRRAWLMSPHHPDLAKTVRYPQLVRAIGGPAAHTANVHKVAAQTGIHPARLLALNSHYRGLIRIV